MGGRVTAVDSSGFELVIQSVSVFPAMVLDAAVLAEGVVEHDRPDRRVRDHLEAWGMHPVRAGHVAQRAVVGLQRCQSNLYCELRHRPGEVDVAVVLLSLRAGRGLDDGGAPEEGPEVLRRADITAAGRRIVQQRTGLGAELRSQEPVQLRPRGEPLHEAPLLLVLRPAGREAVRQVVRRDLQNNIVLHQPVARPRNGEGKVTFRPSSAQGLRYKAVLWRIQKPSGLPLQRQDLFGRVQPLQHHEAVGSELAQRLHRHLVLPLRRRLKYALRVDQVRRCGLAGARAVRVELWPSNRVVRPSVAKWLQAHGICLFRRHLDSDRKPCSIDRLRNRQANIAAG
mmetsp:Transcript_67383/g.219510  ORF Transcript_67383/g.219510 Transcript_67383/m.219510 type:complete len:340 (+) Transcript_67383:263-1282(+)